MISIEPREPLTEESADELAARLWRTSEPGARDVVRRLLASGSSLALVDRVLGEIEARDARGAWAIDAAAEVLGRRFRWMHAPREREGEPPVLVFVGPPSCGKSVLAAKLALRLVRRGKAPLSFAVGATGERVEAAGLPPSRAIADGEDLRRACRRFGTCDLAIVDTPGFTPRSSGGVRRLAHTLRGLAPAGADVRLCWVLPATLGVHRVEELLSAFAPLRPDALAVSFLDATRSPAPVLETAARVRLPLAFLGAGPGPEDPLWRATPDRIGDLFLMGHLTERRSPGPSPVGA